MKLIDKKFHTSAYLPLAALFLIAFLERTVFDLGPNIELVTAAMIISSFYFGKRESFWLTFAVVATTDRFIGNSNIFLFTWSGFLLPAFFASDMIKNVLRRFTKKGSRKISKVFIAVSLTLTGLSVNIFFYFWTNFGVWFLDSWNMYPNTLQGLTLSYINGLPFLKYQFISSLIFIPLIFITTELVIFFETKVNFSDNKRLSIR